MTRQNLDIKAGHVFYFTDGEYSDYCIQGHFLALRAIGEAELLAIAETVNAECDAAKARDGRRRDRHERFIAALIATGAVMAFDAQQIYMGSYGELDLA